MLWALLADAVILAGMFTVACVAVAIVVYGVMLFVTWFTSRKDTA